MHKRKVNGKKAVKLVMKIFRDKFVDYHTKFINKHFTNLAESIKDFCFEFYLSNNFGYPIRGKVIETVAIYNFVGNSFMVNYEDHIIKVYPFNVDEYIKKWK